MKAKGHLEFCQWFKRYFELHYNTEEPYDAVKKRKGKELYYIMDSRQQNVVPKKEKSANPGFLRKITQKFGKKKKEVKEAEKPSPRGSARASNKSGNKATDRGAPTRAGKRPPPKKTGIGKGSSAKKDEEEVVKKETAGDDGKKVGFTAGSEEEGINTPDKVSDD